MPIKKSAKKAMRQNIRRRSLNRRYKKRIKELTKEVRSLAQVREKQKIKELLPLVYKNIDKAAKRGVIKKNTAARKKSRLAKLAK